MSRRDWGKIKKQPTKTPSYQASYVGPDGRRHYAPHTFASKTFAQGWLAHERDYKERCTINGERWKTPTERAMQKQAEVLRLSTYGKTVIDQRKLAQSSYEQHHATLVAVIDELAPADAETTATAITQIASALDELAASDRS